MGSNEQMIKQHQSQMNQIQKWLDVHRQKKIQTNNDSNECKDNELKEQIIEKTHSTKKKHWKLRKRRRIMRFSEKLSKEFEEQKSEQNIKKDKMQKNDEQSEREQLVQELEQMTKLLKKGVIDLRKTLRDDKESMNDLDEETHGTLDKVSALNQRLSKYVESTSGMTCTMCLMMATLIYFI